MVSNSWVPSEVGVSAREAEVLAALAEHLTNGEIGARLFISVRTVESHVSSLLRKLQVGDRGALAAAAATLRPAAANSDAPSTIAAALPSPLTRSSGEWLNGPRWAGAGQLRAPAGRCGGPAGAAARGQSPAGCARQGNESPGGPPGHRATDRRRRAGGRLGRGAHSRRAVPRGMGAQDAHAPGTSAAGPMRRRPSMGCAATMTPGLSGWRSWTLWRRRGGRCQRSTSASSSTPSCCCTGACTNNRCSCCWRRSVTISSVAE